MKKIGLLMVIFLLMINIASAIEYINVKDVKIDSFGGLYPSVDQIYVTSIIRYNVTLENNQSKSFNDGRFSIAIVNPAKEVIENETFTIDIKENSTFSFASNVSDEWKLIYGDVSGVYKLILTSHSDLQLYEKKDNSHRHDYSLPIYFEVKSSQDKIWEERSNEAIDLVEDLAKSSGRNINIALVMLIIISLSLLHQIRKDLHPWLFLIEILAVLAFIGVLLWHLLGL